MFSKDQDQRPVYVEIDEQHVEMIAEFLECDSVDVRKKINSIVAERIIATGTSHDRFIGIHKNLLFWRTNAAKTLTSYPEIPLLLTMTFAAVDMGGEGGHDPNAYYPRLFEMLKINNSNSTQESYRSFSAYLWGSLNFYLDVIQKSSLGVGTAYSIGAQKHVGFPMSQALVRSGDRRKLPNFFRRNGFAAFSSLIEHDIEPYIDEWVATEDHALGSFRTPSMHFRRLWEQSDARTKIAAIICRELESWDGMVPKVVREDWQLIDEDDEILVRLEATKASFPVSRLNISFAISGFTLTENQSIGVLDNSESVHQIALATDPSGWMRPNVGILPISDKDLLEKGLNLQYGSNLKTSRSPKKVVVLRLDDLTRRYREVERIELGVRSFVLVQEFKEAVNSVEEILKSCAREDWKKIDSQELPGLPAGWILFSEVELLQPPAYELVKHVNLEALKPVLSGSLAFSSGLQLPGRIPKWHGAIGLEIRASVVGSKKIKVQIHEILEDENILITEEVYFHQTIIHPIGKSQLSDGDYRVSILVDDDEEPFATRKLNIRTSDSPDQESWKNTERLVYDLARSGKAALLATGLETEEILYIDGAFPFIAENAVLNLARRDPQEIEWWGSKTAIIESRVRSFGLSDSTQYECFEKGNHRFNYPAAISNKAGTGFAKTEGGKITGTCVNCGLIKRSPADPWVLMRMRERALDKEGGKPTEIAIPKVSVSELPPVGEVIITPDHALDALMHLGGGSDGSISSIASNVDPSALFRHEFVRTLEQLAHIDVARDALYQIANWEFNPSMVVRTSTDYFLAGYWPSEYLNRLMSVLGEENVYNVDQPGAVSRLTIKPIALSIIEQCLNDFELEIPIIDQPSLDFLKVLPDIRIVAESLPFLKSPIFDEVCEFSAEQNAWIPVSEVRPNKVGGYRVSSAYRNQYVVVTADDINLDQIRFVSAEFAKFYSSAVMTKKPLFSFRSREEYLLVPKGAPLPGMYGRAAVMASGYLPKPDSSGRYLIYSNISKDFTELLAARLGGQ
jgi:hypothetical protein